MRITSEFPVICPQFDAKRGDRFLKANFSLLIAVSCRCLDQVSVVHSADLTKRGECFQNLLHARSAGANESAGYFVHAKHLVAAQGILDELYLLRKACGPLQFCCPHSGRHLFFGNA